MQIIENPWILAAVATIALVMIVITSVALWRRRRAPELKMFECKAMVPWTAPVEKESWVLTFIKANPLRAISLGAMCLFLLLGILGTLGVLWTALNVLGCILAVLAIVGGLIVGWARSRDLTQDAPAVGSTTLTVWMIGAVAVLVTALALLIKPMMMPYLDSKWAEWSKEEVVVAVPVQTSTTIATSSVVAPVLATPAFTLTPAPVVDAPFTAYPDRWTPWYTMPVQNVEFDSTSVLDFEFEEKNTGRIVKRQHIPGIGIRYLFQGDALRHEEPLGAVTRYRLKAAGNTAVTYTAQTK